MDREADAASTTLEASPQIEPKQSIRASRRPIRLLTFTTLFPHQGRPNHGVFVENRLRHLLASGEATSTVIAPVPWFPSSSPRFGDWGKNAKAGRLEHRNGIVVHHPRYPLLPRIGMSTAPAALFAAGAREFRRLKTSGQDFDVIDGHYIYPDGVAAVALGRAFKKPVVLTARGSDITQFPAFRWPGRMIGWAMQNSAALISVSAGLKSAMVELGAPDRKVTVLRNGVDLAQFRPTNPRPAWEEWGVSEKIILSVGHLIDRKRHNLIIEALPFLPGWTLVLIGDGLARQKLERLATEIGVRSRVIFGGQKPHAALAAFYSAADIFVLASSREGWANVLLEAMACGTPVVASNIPGNPEVVTDIAAGLIVAENTPICFAETIMRLATLRKSRSATRAYAENYDWNSTTNGQLAIFREVLERVTA